jgi:hypothetical protein
MRKLFIGLGALAVAGFALPAATPASAQDRTVIIKKDRGHHEGWRHHNWRRHNAKVVIVKKHKRWHHDHD